MLPSFSDIRYFLEVAVTGNISRASERLGISQPSLSLAIKRVEESLGTSLLLRNKNGVQLNQAGKKFTQQARQLLHQWEQIKSQTLSSQEEISGQYTIGCHQSVALYSLPYFMKDLLSKNPQLEVNLKHDLSRKITEEVISFQIDFGIVVNPVQHPDLVIKSLCTDKVTLWTANKPSPNQNIKDGNAVLICDQNLLQTQAITKKLNSSVVKFNRIVTSSSLEVISSMVAKGVGIGILPTRVAELQPKKTLKAIDSIAFFNDKICLVYRADAQKTKAAKTIIAAISELFKK
ncbi:MAG: LysR family transcriptional regulator [Bdellovibrionales bacterium]|nr:LysR family transcriptional regulator [Bdellovibrionales bacterium]